MKVKVAYGSALKPLLRILLSLGHNKTSMFKHDDEEFLYQHSGTKHGRPKKVDKYTIDPIYPICYCFFKVWYFLVWL